MNVQSLDRRTEPVPYFDTIEAFFRWIDQREERYELVDGVPHMQPFVKRGHSLIVSNVDYALQRRLDRHLYSVHQGDFAVPTGPRSVRYADVLVEPRSTAMNERKTEDAIVLVEVLSESTMHVDFGAKKSEYQRLAKLQAYVILAQDSRHATLWSRGEDGAWLAQPELVEEGELRLPALGVTIPFDEIYFGVIDAPTTTSAA